MTLSRSTLAKTTFYILKGTSIFDYFLGRAAVRLA
jgi:hypothetical protein